MKRRRRREFQASWSRDIRVATEPGNGCDRNVATPLDARRPLPVPKTLVVRRRHHKSVVAPFRSGSGINPVRARTVGLPIARQRPFGCLHRARDGWLTCVNQVQIAPLQGATVDPPISVRGRSKFVVRSRNPAILPPSGNHRISRSLILRTKTIVQKHE
jgi:hypothetical protein